MKLIRHMPLLRTSCKCAFCACMKYFPTRFFYNPQANYTTWIPYFTCSEKGTTCILHNATCVTYYKWALIWGGKICQIFCKNEGYDRTLWKNEKFSLTKNFFRQINSLVTYLVKPLLSRNFCQKCVRENSRNFHTMCSEFLVFPHQLEIPQNFSHSIITSTVATSGEKWKIYSHIKEISSNQLLIQSFL